MLLRKPDDRKEVFALKWSPKGKFLRNSLLVNEGI